jgi:uncharacterized membrane protein HdeD (DUF308 family)
LTRLDDFLEPLERGVFEVIIEKSDVTEPLDEGWEASKINLPSPGTIASCRKGQYHVHETKTEWKVHKDRYDPKDHPFLHLVDDAPLVFMMAGTFNSLLFDTKSSLKKDPFELLEEHKIAWQLLFVTGVFLIILGTILALDPLRWFTGFIKYIVPMVIIGFALFLIWRGFSVQPIRIESPKRMMLGFGVLLIGIAAFLINPIWIALMFVLVIALWAFSSAILSLKRTAKGRLATPEGFYKRLGMGVFSLILAVAVLVLPAAIVSIIMYLLAAMAILIGIALILDSMGLRRAFKDLDLEKMLSMEFKKGGDAS